MRLKFGRKKKTNPIYDRYYMNPTALIRDKESGASAKVHAKPKPKTKTKKKVVNTKTKKRKEYIPQTQRKR